MPTVKMKKKTERVVRRTINICDYKSSAGLSKSKSYDRTIPFWIHSKRDWYSTLFYLLFLPPYSHATITLCAPFDAWAPFCTYTHVCLFVFVSEFSNMNDLLACFYCMAFKLRNNYHIHTSAESKSESAWAISFINSNLHCHLFSVDFSLI